METAKLLEEGEGEKFSQCWGQVSPNQKGFLLSLSLLFICLSSIALLWAVFLMGIPRSSQKHLWAPIIGSLVYRPFISFSGNKSHGQTAEACHFRSRFLNRSAPLTFRDRKFLSWGLSWHCRVFSSISGLLDASTKTFTPIMTTKNVSRYFPMFPGGRITPI